MKVTASGFNALQFGVPKSSRHSVSAKQDPYPDIAAFIMESRPEDADRKAYRTTLNSKAIELLGFDMESKENTIGISFAGEGVVAVVNTTGLDIEGAIQFKKNGSFSNKDVYEYITKNAKLDRNVDQVFEIQPAGEGEEFLFEGRQVYVLSPYQIQGESTDTSNEVADEVADSASDYEGEDFAEEVTNEHSMS